MTHVRNVETFGQLKGFCSGYGGKFNPGPPNLRNNFLDALSADAQRAVYNAKAAKARFDLESDNREIAFSNVRKLASAVLLTLASSGASAQTLSNARAFLRQMEGKRSKNPAPVVADKAAQAQATPKSRTVAHQDFASMADHLAGLVLTVSGEPRYQPNEPELSVAGLNAKVDELRSKNQDAHAAYMLWSNARIERNRVLYTDPNSLLATAVAVKKYVKAIYGAGSEQYRQVRRLRFTKPRI